MPDSFRDGEIKGVVVRKLVRNLDSRGWLAELFRSDELDEEFFPAMSYISATTPGVTRGPHEHWDQADFFCFIGPSNFKLRFGTIAKTLRRFCVEIRSSWARTIPRR
jgi:dTDP-4-dehydrorhamnose 3,5-epimerase